MAPKRILAAVACATLVALGTPAFADEYRADEFFGLDLSRAVLSPKRLGPPAEFSPVPVEARTDARRAVAEPKAEHPRMVRTTRVIRHAYAEKPRTPARARLARRHTNPLEAQARMPTSHIKASRVQTWPCRSGGICNWK
jgi:hypothetical protein